MDHRRKNTLRLPDHNYSEPRAYFVTIVTHGRSPLLAQIRGERSDLSVHGEVVDKAWKQLPDRFPKISLDRFIVMPDHLHGILWIEPVGAIHELPLQTVKNLPEEERSRRRMTLSKAVGYFKMNTAKQINRALGRTSNPFWQRGYYEHIIRNPDDLDQIRTYISQNPRRWSYKGNHSD